MAGAPRYTSHMLLTRRKLAQLAIAAAPLPATSAEAGGATHRVAEFIAKTQYADIPHAVIELGRKSILDGLGLALAGSVAATGRIVREYLEQLGLTPGGATVIGSRLQFTPRFAAFANGIGIHADDYDDTQLAAAPDRVRTLVVDGLAVPGHGEGLPRVSMTDGAETWRAEWSGVLPEREWVARLLAVLDLS